MVIFVGPRRVSLSLARAVRAQRDGAFFFSVAAQEEPHQRQQRLDQEYKLREEQVKAVTASVMQVQEQRINGLQQQLNELQAERTHAAGRPLEPQVGDLEGSLLRCVVWA